MKKLIIIFLCCITAFSINLFYGCKNDDNIDDIMSDIPQIENDQDINQQENDENKNSDQIENDNQNQTSNEVIQDNVSKLILAGYKVQSKTNLNIRAQASASSAIIGQLSEWDTIPVIEKVNDSWYKVFYNNDIAYVSANKSYIQEVAWQNAQSTLVTGLEVEALTTVNIRAQASTGSEVLGKLEKWQTVSLVEKISDQWYKVLYNGQEAYISASKDLTRVYDPEKVNAIIDKIIETGMSVLGTPYEFGATRILNYSGNLNPNFTGKTFDCSSFVQYAFYKGAGIKLQGDSRSQSKYGMLVNKSELKRGDLIFMWSSARRYNTGIERIGHVVIYIGDNKILHTWGTGGVRIQEFSSGWQERFIHARRML
ncbi:MAG TPA: SH3 domain-containing C40 family peptidase [Clostridia bacterium]